MRYGHQPLNVLLDSPMDDLWVLAEEIAELIQLENSTNSEA